MKTSDYVASNGDTLPREKRKEELTNEFANPLESSLLHVDCSILNASFEAGELYLFHLEDPACPAEESLWGCYECNRDSGQILLENSTVDLNLFRLKGELPKAYKYHRLATRAELRDYAYALARYECRLHALR
uniref:hypothetical protein n=1 Tax=Alistipes sp. TaxID=1872444 RepID=UPI004055D50E